tara:strand:+ start:442 stop:855 length:414 start_codon:yes stop_codon:yes gene_type:complete
MKKMRFRIILFIFIISYITFESFLEYFQSNNSITSNDIQREITIDENELKVFETKSLDNINVIEKRTKAWAIKITYNQSNKEQIITLLEKSGYKAHDNSKKMYFSVGPFVDISHAKDESNKLKKLHNINGKVIDFIF